jgi:hypothetical protein
VHLESWRWINNQADAEKIMYLLVSQHVSGIIIPIIRRTVQSWQRLWCTALAVLQQTRGEEVLYTIGVVGSVLFSWWWEWWCPKHVETPINTSSFLYLVSWNQSQQVHTEPPLLLESAAARPVLYTIGVVSFVLFSCWWAWWCPKHVETPINTSSSASSWLFFHLQVIQIFSHFSTVF